MTKIGTVLFAILLVSQFVFAQEKEKDSAIYINEVVVTKSSAFKIASKLSRSETVGFNEGESFVTLVRNIPNLKFSSITLYFGYKNSKETEQEYEFELLLLTKTEEDKPGETIIANPVKFKVKTGNFKKVKLDLGNLEIANHSEIFVGFRTVDLRNRAIAVQFHKNENAISYAKNEMRNWFTPVRAFPLELKFDLEFEKKQHYSQHLLQAIAGLPVVERYKFLSQNREFFQEKKLEKFIGFAQIRHGRDYSAPIPATACSKGTLAVILSKNLVQMNKHTYLENRITELISEMASSFADLQYRLEIDSYGGNDDVSHEEEEIRDMIRSSFVENTKSVYKLICNYLEDLNHLQYLSEFKLAMMPYLTDNKKMLSGEMNDYDGQVHNKLISEISDFLNAYEFYGERGYEYLMKRAGIFYLENILENTAVIINDLKQKPSSETAVYKSVKIACKAAFPNAEYPTTPFISIAKEYKPDILIPYLNCAIEYKYATDETRLKEIIDQILIDVHGYSNHPTYKIFYAVFYVKPDIWGRKKFEEVWNEKKFPKNWKGIYVVG